ncbi:magnesium/cobalt transporter CorA [Gottschalkiaceae bacterium SANA]|nr:magnesium/cobalt transporter CorA [Gottschalkiaceae bacterium SANA]
MITQANPSVKNQAPGTITYTGTYADVPLSMVLYQYKADHWTKEIIDDLSGIPDDDKIKWLNVTGLSHTKVIQDIGTRFSIDPLILEDIVNVSQYSKMQSDDDLLFSVWKMIYMKEKQIEHEHISLLLIDNWVISFQENEGDVFHSVRTRLEKNQGILRTMKGDYLYFALIDSIVDHYSDTLSILTQQFDAYEANFLDQKKVTADSLYPLRKELTQLKSAIFPMKIALPRVMNSKHQLITEEVLPYFQDAYDNLLQTAEQLLSIRELATSLHDQQLSELSNQMNSIMTTLTIFSAVFIPLSFLAGVFGMNFRSLPGTESTQGFVFFLLACLIMAATMLMVFKRKKWF